LLDSSFSGWRGAQRLYRERWSSVALPLLFSMYKKQGFSRKTKALAAATLAQKIGYLKTEHFPQSFFDNIPNQTFNAHKIIRPKDELFVVEQGIVEIWHTKHDMLVNKLEAGTLFGDMPLLGQSMYGCQAIAGSGGDTLGVMNLELITERVKENPIKALEEIGPRLIRVETEHYRIGFQTTDTRLAALLLELTGESSIVAGYGHEELSQRLGVYRETVTMSMRAMKENRLIEIGRKRITILDKNALEELSEL
jgi:CRP/FNR family transcriptional regulator, cyclic AMP receptor protein